MVTLVADWTDRNETIKKILDEYKLKQIPVLAIYPKGRAEDAIILTGGYTQATLEARLNESSDGSADKQVADNR